jgi:hypothetical protein
VETKGARDPNQIVEGGWFETAAPGKVGDQERTDLIGAVQIQNPFLMEQNPRKEVMREPLDFWAAVQNGEGVVGQDPGVRSWCLFRFRWCNGFS